MYVLNNTTRICLC